MRLGPSCDRSIIIVKAPYFPAISLAPSDALATFQPHLPAYHSDIPRVRVPGRHKVDVSRRDVTRP